MSDEYRRGRVEPPRDIPEDSRYPPAGETEDRRRLPPVAADGMPLPSMPYPPPGPGYPPDQRYQDRGYPPDPRYQPDPRSWPPEPSHPNGYPPQSDARYPPPFPPQDPRQYEDRRPYDDRRQYDDRRPFDDQRLYDDQRQYSDRRAYPDPYYDAQAAQGRPGGYGPDYYRYHQPPYPYMGGPPPAAASQQQSAPRQRTSIACRYCRKRKIRCSGYTHTTNGKCTNCDKLKIDCIFQPVSSNSSAAFVPVSAVPGGVPPGTPLYGAYGQPLPPSSAPGPQPRAYQYPPSSDYTPSLHSPTGGYPAYDDKDPGRRRTRPSEEEHSSRPPPPNFPADDDPRRRSPVSLSSNGTPPAAYRQYQQSPYDRDRPPTPNQNSPGRAMPPRPQSQPPQAQSQPPLQAQPQPQPSSSYQNPMSLDNLIGREPRAVNDIDRSMLGRLNRRT